MGLHSVSGLLFEEKRVEYLRDIISIGLVLAVLGIAGIIIREIIKFQEEVKEIEEWQKSRNQTEKEKSKENGI